MHIRFVKTVFAPFVIRPPGIRKLGKAYVTAQGLVHFETVRDFSLADVLQVHQPAESEFRAEVF